MKLICLLLTLSVAALAGPITMQVYPSVGPYRDLSPSYPAYTANALLSLYEGLGQDKGGAITATPTAYNVTPTIPISWMFYTGWKSWLGVADPAAPFNNEVGNHLYFGLHAVGQQGTLFSLSQLSYVQSSSDALNYFSDAYSYAGDSYRFDRIGISYGADGIRGTGDDVIYTAGPGTILVNELLYVGVGVSFDASGYGGAHQAALNQAILDARQLGSFKITTCYTITLSSEEHYTSCGDVTTPEPAAMGLLAVGLALFGLRWRARKA